MEKRIVYDAPVTEKIFVNFEENFLQTGINPGGEVPEVPDGGDD
jgi:hypothetical protein